MLDTIKKLFGTSHEREIKRARPVVARINDLEPRIKALSDVELRGQTAKFRERLDRGEPLNDLLPEAFATVREASRRVIGMRHYDVQLIGGMILHRGAISEMKTGEGKTLVATSPLYLNALEGKGAHLVTVNDYLATRDAEWMGRVYKFLGMSIGVIYAHDRNGNRQQDYEKQIAYRADITYGTNNEFGFDYLRDNMKDSIERYVQRPLHYAIVDEVDSILIDEARTPLIISGQGEASADLYARVNVIIPSLKKDIDFTLDEKAHSVMLTDAGIEKVEKKLGLGNLYDAENLAWNHHVQQALRAHSLYKRDVNYVVEEGKIVIVDEFTGRKMQGRRWSDGLHQAIEAKENVNVEEENETLATISFQNLFRLYKKLAGMTGTADTEASEFHEIYKLDVVQIPTNLPNQRRDDHDVVYKNERAKFKAVIEEIAGCHERGQPTLIGTVSVEKSEVLASMLKKRNIPHTVLNATKAFNLVLGESLWDELRTRGVDVLACRAGATRTPNYEGTRPAVDQSPVMEPEAVVTRALAALGRRPSVVTGGFNKLATFFLGRVLPRQTAIRTMGRACERCTASPTDRVAPPLARALSFTPKPAIVSASQAQRPATRRRRKHQ